MTAQQHTGAASGAAPEPGARSDPAIRGRWTRSLLDAMPDAVVVVDRAGVIVLANRASEQLFGYAQSELVGATIELLVPETQRAAHSRQRTTFHRRPHERPMGSDLPLSGRRRDGTTFPADVSLSMLETDDGVVVAASVRDVTERVESQERRERLEAQAARDRLEAQAHRSQRLESLGQLADGVAHEFNNLLAVISNYASFALGAVTAEADRSGGPWQAVRHDVEQIQLAAQRATTLTHQLLAFGAQDAGAPRELDVNSVIRDLGRLLQRTLGEHIELSGTLAPSLPPIRMDAGKLEQALVNLAINARDAMPSGGRLRIETQADVVDEELARAHVGLHPGSYVKVRVSDDGVGMPPEVRRHAFEPFFSTKPSGDGTGLGLATVYGIVAHAGGWATIDSEAGMGTTVTLLLPATGGAPVDAEAEGAPVALPAHETILLVEDEDALRAVAERILSGSGYTVLVASSGPEALDVARRHDGAIHLLLTDVMMPTMLGSELAARLRSSRPQIAVVFMSGYSQPVLSAQAAIGPGADVLEKPFSEAGMLGKVRAALDARSRALR